jgi:hypothetical protein
MVRLLLGEYENKHTVIINHLQYMNNDDGDSDGEGENNSNGDGVSEGDSDGDGHGDGDSDGDGDGDGDGLIIGLNTQVELLAGLGAILYCWPELLTIVRTTSLAKVFDGS